ncbi:MAG: TetR/AcrR family transcriptional regulator [Deltaproteobacteria bacterium]|nr:TetR/AcrR family transcriptional regulator [Deltaproteobacteria bacterium]MBI3387896.1 TetR/AcrR family transcriptional regulator [Deltaproteobacteria bacterium]
MKSRAAQREDTRNRIVVAAAKAFSEMGFRAASTRDIAARAGVNQGLITYYFQSKQELWKAAAGQIFDQLREVLAQPLGKIDAADRRARARERIREYVRFAAAHPELFRLMVEEGKQSDARMRWVVDTHMKPFYERFAANNSSVKRKFLPHAFYALAGGASMIFAIRPECRRLTGLDPADKRVVETHAEFMARLLVP